MRTAQPTFGERERRCVKRETRFVMNDWANHDYRAREVEKSLHFAAQALSNDRHRTLPSSRLKSVPRSPYCVHICPLGRGRCEL